MSYSHLQRAANRKKALTITSRFLGVVFALSALTMAGLIDGETINGEPCSIWIYLSVFAIAIISYIGCMTLSDMAEKTGSDR